ncbi:MAG: esterase/lipase family protein [Myxococcota bacterium]
MSPFPIDDQPLEAPVRSLRSVAAELRGLASAWVALGLRVPELRAAPRGSGEPVLVIPGFRTSDHATVVVRRYLRALGYRVDGWGLGVNAGRIEQVLPIVAAQAEAMLNKTGIKPRLVGWSLGGVIAREVARDYPHVVDRVVTMGTPVIGGPKYTVAAGSFAEINGEVLDAYVQRIEERLRRPLPVPVTAIFSRNDRVVAWRACRDPYHSDVDYVEVAATHAGLGFHPQVLLHVAAALADGVPNG